MPDHVQRRFILRERFREKQRIETAAGGNHRLAPLTRLRMADERS